RRPGDLRGLDRIRLPAPAAYPGHQGGAPARRLDLPGRPQRVPAAALALRQARLGKESAMSTTVENTVEVRPFQVEIPEEKIDDLRHRIKATRLPSKELVDARSQGVHLATIQALADYWMNEYDFGRVESRLNALPQFTTEIDGEDIHFIHVQSRHEDALPLIMTHGWPGSVIELLETVGPLTDPSAHGGGEEDAFHLVLPSLPGYGFSAVPSERGSEHPRCAA